jgi:hypothetical protein
MIWSRRIKPLNAFPSRYRDNVTTPITDIKIITMTNSMTVKPLLMGTFVSFINYTIAYQDIAVNIASSKDRFRKNCY